MSLSPRALLLASLLLPLTALAGDRVFQFRSAEDPNVTAAPNVCDAAPFRVNVKLLASLWATENRSKDGKEMNEASRRVGTAVACVRLTNFTFPAGLSQQMYARFEVDGDVWEAHGSCTIVSNDVPRTGLVLAGCALKITRGPAGVVGGLATSATVFNPFRLTGFATGSHWTLRAYDTSAGPHDDEPHVTHDHDIREHDDQRTDAQISSSGGTP